jgi:hypothetical protein
MAATEEHGSGREGRSHGGSVVRLLLSLSSLLLRRPSGKGTKRKAVYDLVSLSELTPQAIVSIAHIWSRLLSIKKILRTMPKPYVPTKQIDLSKVRARAGPVSHFDRQCGNPVVQP